MSLDSMLALDAIEALENYIEKIRPEEAIRDKVDVAYKIENQSIIIYEIRPNFRDPKQKIESLVAKATFVKAKDYYKVFWMRSDFKWHSYKPVPTVKTIRDFIQVVEEDTYSCFWG
jgi:hypothetical protein